MTQRKDTDVLRRQLRFRSWHRGTKEMDLILGPFADACLQDFGQTQLTAYQDLLTEPDPELYDWITESKPAPDTVDATLVRAIIDFHKNRQRAG